MSVWPIRIVLLATAFAMVTAAVGWWGVAATGVLWGWWAGRDVARPVVHSIVAAVVGWSALLGLAAPGGGLGRLAERLGTLLGLPGGITIVVTLSVAVVLAGSGTWFGASVRGPESPSSRP
jgi:hypothetical protein